MVPNPQLLLKVEIYPGYTPATYVFSLTSGTDITSYVRLEEGMTYSRGASDETSYASAGRLTLVLNNRDYRFTPDNTSSSLFPYIKNKLPIKISIGEDNLWIGFVETVEEQWNGGLQSTVTLTASDRLAVLARQTLPPAVAAQQKLDGAIALYPLSDDTGSTSSADISGNGYAPLRRQTYGTTTTATTQAQIFAVGAFGSDSDQNVLQMTRHSSTVGYYMAANTQIASNATGTLEGYFYLSTGAMNGVLMRVESGANGYAVHANSPATFVTTDLTTEPPTSTTQITGTTTIDNYQWHHIALTWSNVGSTTTWTLYVDGVSEGTYAETIASGPAILRLYIGGAETATPATCWAANVAVYPNVLSSTVLTDHAKAVTGFTETSLQRFERLLAIAGLTGGPGGSAAVTMGPQPTSGRAVLDILTEIADAEDGSFYLSRGDTVIYLSQAFRETLTYTPTSINPKYLSPSTTIMRAPVSVNTVIASRPNGGTVTASDSTSVTENGVMSESISLYVTNDATLQRVAKRRLYRRSLQQPRIGNVTMNLTTCDDNEAHIYMAPGGVEIGTFLSIGPLPRGNVDTLLVRIEGHSDTITPSSWVRTYVTSPMYVSKSSTSWVVGTSLLGYTTTI